MKYSLKIFFFIFCLGFSLCAFAGDDVEVSVDLDADTTALPNVFKPCIDVSGRGFHHAVGWPQGVAAADAIDRWHKEIGFNGIYRIQYNLWEISQAAKDTELHDKLLANYEATIKRISDAGGVVIVDIFGTPAGLGKILDKKSAPLDFRAFKELVKNYIREFSCKKKYNIWYEVWSAPDLEDFFLGRKLEYLYMYKAIAEAVKELEDETKTHIPLGGPGASWWFQNFNTNTVMTGEESLIYDLIKFCYRYHLPLDFITWHAYSTDPKQEQEVTRYRKISIALIRDWLSYFDFDKETPLIVDEWNYDSGANSLAARGRSANIAASYIPARISNMSAAGLNYQIYFSLEDFKDNEESVVRNTGVFWFDSRSSEYKGGAKSIYNVFRMLALLGKDMLVIPLLEDEFVGVMATKTNDGYAFLLYNYIDPYLARNYFSRNIATLSEAERRMLLQYIKSNEIEKILNRTTDIATLRIGKRLKALLKKGQELNDAANKFKVAVRTVKLNLANLKDKFVLEKYIVDSRCNNECVFTPAEQKDIALASGTYQETISMEPYSVQMIILMKKAAEEVTPALKPEEPSLNPAVKEEPSGK